MKKYKFFNSPFQLLGFAALFSGIYMMIGGVQNYIAQHDQMDWIVETAEVSDISSRVESTNSGARRSSRTVYDIIYQYEVNGQTYTNELRGASNIRMIGDTMKIKYDPEAPENSTTTLSPQLSDLLIPFGVGIVFSVLGFFISGIYAWVRWLQRKGKPEEEEILPPEEYVDATTIQKAPKGIPIIIMQRVIPLLIFIGIFFLSRNLFPGTRAIGTDQFIDTVEANGYTTTDTTNKLQQEWKVGSMLQNAVSLETGSIRIDFCVMDSVDSCRNLYHGMTLPVSDGEKLEYNGISHNFQSMENNEMYTVKIRVGNTVIYAASLTENKMEVVKILKSIGYLEE